MNPEKAVITVLVLSLEKFENGELAALNLAVNNFGKVSQQNLSFDKAKDHAFINDDGSIRNDLKPYLTYALAVEVNRRVSEGTFV